MFRFKMGENYNNLKELRDKDGFQRLTLLVAPVGPQNGCKSEGKSAKRSFSSKLF